MLAGVKFKPAAVEKKENVGRSLESEPRKQTDSAREDAPRSWVPRTQDDKYIRDKRGRVLGMLRESGDRTELLNQNGNRVLGWYDSSRDETRDGEGRIVGLGNLLITLLRVD